MNMQIGLNQGMESLGERIKTRRLALGLTQGEVAKAAGIKQPDLSKIERGDIQEPKKILGIAKALHCDPAWLSTGKYPIEPTTPSQHDHGAETVKIYPPAPKDYDQWTLGAIALMTGLKEYQREGALAALKMYVAQLGPPRDGQALQMAG